MDSNKDFVPDAFSAETTAASHAASERVSDSDTTSADTTVANMDRFEFFTLLAESRIVDYGWAR